MTKESERIRVLIADDHSIVRDGIATIVRSQPDMEVCGEAKDAAEAISMFVTLRPDVTFMDIRLPDMSGIDALIQIRKQFPTARIVMLTTYQGEVQAARALRAGASGYLLKTSLRRDLQHTIRAVHSGQHVIPPEIAKIVALHTVQDELSEREQEVLRQVALGLSNKAIADRLRISVDTVKSHITNAMSKLSANDRTHAVSIAHKQGYFDLEN
jgi:DNA-binding NarL/FixJ family response regulator